MDAASAVKANPPGDGFGPERPPLFGRVTHPADPDGIEYDAVPAPDAAISVTSSR